jgi:hypothetical protein
MTNSADVPTNKTELLAFMRDQWAGFVSASDALPDEVWLFLVNSDGWSIRDQVGHVVLWTRAEIPLLTDGTPIAVTAGVPDSVRKSSDPNAVNEWFRESLQHLSPAEIRAERDRVFPRLFAAVSSMSEEDLAQPARVSGLEKSDRPLLQVMTENYGLHFDDHRAQIEQLGKTSA